MLGRTYDRLLRSVEQVNAMLKVKLGRPLVNTVLCMVPLMGRKVNLSVVKVVITFLSTCHRLQSKGGMRFLVIYLKACSTLLQQSIGGQKLSNMSPLGCRLRRTKGGGLPRCIPMLHRIAIGRGSVFHIKLWATFFGLYRILACPWFVKLNTITDPSKYETDLMPEFSNFCINSFWVAIKANFPVKGGITDIFTRGDFNPLEFMKTLRAVPFLISKSGPQITPGNAPGGVLSTSPLGIAAAAAVWSRSNLYPCLETWCKMTDNHWLLNRINLWKEASLGWEEGIGISPNSPTAPFEPKEQLGKLGFKQEPAGKVRVFAMVDPLTQWLLSPLHEAIFDLLKRIPQDGTFNQLRPIERLNKTFIGPLYSFDLSSATDRIPLAFQKILLSPILSSWGAETWGNLLVGREYVCGKSIKFKGQPKQLLSETGGVHYAAGQPMGALSSWAMLALIHHSIVQWAAVRAGVIPIGSWYSHYAILGDDVVIGGADVAKEYRELMRRLDVGIGDHKSLISRAGRALEFAKRTFYKGKDVSMIPFAEFIICRQNLMACLELCRKYSLSLGGLLSALGFGYKSKGRVSSRITTLSKRLQNYIIAYYGPSGPGFTDLKTWMTMKSLSSIFRSADARVHELCTRVLELEKSRILERLESLRGLVDLARNLATVYRDREHYGTIKRDGDTSSTEGVQRLVITNPDNYPWYNDDLGLIRQQSVTLSTSTIDNVPTACEAIVTTSLQPTEGTLVSMWREHLRLTVQPEWISTYDTQYEFDKWAGCMLRAGRLDGLDLDDAKETVVETTIYLAPPCPDVEIVQERPVESLQAQGLSLPRQTATHIGMSHDTPRHVIDSINETVYREAFLDVAIEYRDLCTKMDELSVTDLSWVGLEELWAELDAVEVKLGVLPLPKSLSVRLRVKARPGLGNDVRRWRAYSGIFRATV